MGKLQFLNVVNALTVAAGAAQDVIKDIMRNDQVAGSWVFFTRSLPILSPSDTTNVAASVATIKLAPGPGSHLHVGKFSTVHSNDVNTVVLYYERVGGKFKIGRNSTDTNLLAQTVYGDPDRTTFPSIQQFCEKALTNSAARALLGTTTAGYTAPASSLVAAIVVDQIQEQIEVMFSTTVQTQTGPIVAILDLSDETVIHFGE